MSIHDYIVGENADLHEFLVRRRHPRFIARVASESAGDTGYSIAGLTLALDDDTWLVEIEWIDECPNERSLLTLIDDINTFLAHIAARDENE